MPVAIPAVLGVLAGVVGVIDTVPYVRDTVRGTTRPHRGAWLIWSGLAVVVCLSQRADGASWTLAMAGTQAVVTSFVFVLAIRWGEGGLGPAEAATIALAGTGVAAWVLAENPTIATGGVMVADLLAIALMVPKVYRDPGSETLATYVLASICGALAVGAVGAFDVALLVYPAYYCVINAGIAALILSRRARATSTPRWGACWSPSPFGS
jgi:hypothetical protein